MLSLYFPFKDANALSVPVQYLFMLSSRYILRSALYGSSPRKWSQRSRRSLNVVTSAGSPLIAVGSAP